MAFVVIYDACVLYPAHLRDLLVRIANTGIVRARWSERILDECFEASRRTVLTYRMLRSREHVIPGATVSASQRDLRIETTTDAAGDYVLPSLGLSSWTVDASMFAVVADRRAVCDPANRRPRFRLSDTRRA